jgi:hypothetical protein
MITTIKTILQKIINYFKSLFKKKKNNTKVKIEEPKIEELDKPNIKRLVYTKRTD